MIVKQDHWPHYIHYH